MKKNILFITPYFAPAWSYGGPPRVLYTLAKELMNLGYDITVITTDALNEKRSIVEKEMLNGIRIYRYKTISNYLSYRHKIFYVQNLLDKTKPIINSADYILFSDLRPLIHWPLYRYIKQNNIPYGIFSFGQIPYDSGIKTIMKKLFDILWVTDFVRNANTRFSQTEHETLMYNKYFHVNKKDIYHLPLAVNFPPQNVSTKQSYQYGLGENDFILLFVGRFNYLKGIDILIKSAASLIDKNRTIKLVLIGRNDGIGNTIEDMIPKHLRSNIILTGPLYNEQLFPFYKIASCFIITPRYYEETSLASLEALSFGIPAIVTKQSDIPLLNKYKAGKVISLNETSIQRAIKEIYKQWKKNKLVMKNNARKLISERYSSNTVANILNNYIKQAIKQ